MPRSALPPSFPSKFSPRSVGRTAYLAPPLVDNSRTPTLSSSSSTSCRPDTQAAITTMIQINPCVCLCCASLARERTGEAAAQGQNSETGLLEVCVGGGAQTEGQGRPDGTLLSSALNFWERERIKCPCHAMLLLRKLKERLFPLIHEGMMQGQWDVIPGEWGLCLVMPVQGLCRSFSCLLLWLWILWWD